MLCRKTPTIIKKSIINSLVFVVGLLSQKSFIYVLLSFLYVHFKVDNIQFLTFLCFVQDIHYSVCSIFISCCCSICLGSVLRASSNKISSFILSSAVLQNGHLFKHLLHFRFLLAFAFFLMTWISSFVSLGLFWWQYLH